MPRNINKSRGQKRRWSSDLERLKQSERMKRYHRRKAHR